LDAEHPDPLKGERGVNLLVPGLARSPKIRQRVR